MNFFNFVHRSIFDPSFYSEIAAFSRKKVVLYLFKLIFLTVIVTGIAHAYYLLHPQRGIASKIEAVFSGMEIIDGHLNPNRAMPYYPPGYLMNPVWGQLVGNTKVLGNNIDSMLVIDTSGNATYPDRVLYVLKKEEIVLKYNKMAMSTPYRDLLHNNKHFKFTSEEIRQTLYANIQSIVTSCLTMSFLQNFFLLIFSIFFLGTAAFIFRVERSYRFFFYLRSASFAVTPIAVGTIIIGLSGVTLSWTWHILVFFSTVVMFRAIIASTKPAKDTGEK